MSATIITALSTGCTRTFLKEKSPDRVAEVSIMERLFFDEGITIKIQSGRRSAVLYTSPRMDWLPGFTEILWARDSQKVSVLTCNQFGGVVIASFDVTRWLEMPSNAASDELRNSIRSKFVQARSKPDPIAWACSQAGADAYHGIDASGRVLPLSH